MELLRFDSKRPSQRYGPMVQHVARSLLDVPVVRASSAIDGHDAAAGRHGLLRSLVTRAERHVPCLGAGGLLPA